MFSFPSVYFLTDFHISYKNYALSAACQIQNQKNRKLKRLISQNHTSRETALNGLVHKWSYLKSRSMNLILVSN